LRAPPQESLTAPTRQVPYECIDSSEVVPPVAGSNRFIRNEPVPQPPLL
jgi:hypothetical protein